MPKVKSKPKKKTPKAKVKAKAKSKALVKKPKAKEVEVLGKDPLSKITKEVSNLKEKQSLQVARELVEGIDCNYFKLGGVLAKIQDESWWEGEGYASFQVYIQAELGMPYRKAMHLINIYDHLVESGIPYEKVKSLGWTKLKEIAPIINEDNVDDWVDTAENMNNLQLMDEVKDFKKGDTPDDKVGEKVKSAVKTKIFKLHKDQQETVEEAIEVAKEACGTEFDSVALEYICLDFLGSPSKKKKAIITKTKAKPKKKAKEVEDDDEWEEDDEDFEN